MTTSDVVGIAAVFIAICSLAVAVVAIRRDRPLLRLESDAGAGNVRLRVVNVGVRPIRIERVGFAGRRRWRRSSTDFSLPLDLTTMGRLHRVGPVPEDIQPAPADPPEESHDPSGLPRALELPLVLEPGYDFIVHIRAEALYGRHPGRSWLVVEDGARRRHVVRWGRRP